MSELTKALIAFQDEVPPIDLNASVNYGKTNFKYADLSNIIKIVQPVLKKNKLAFTHVLKDGQIGCILFHESGEQLESWMGLPETNDAKITGANLTYFRRYTLCAILGIVGDADADAKGTTGEAEPALKSKPNGKPKPNEKQWATIVKGLETGDYDPAQVYEHFSLSEQQRNELSTIIGD